MNKREATAQWLRNTFPDKYYRRPDAEDQSLRDADLLEMYQYDYGRGVENEPDNPNVKVKGGQK